VKKWATSLFNRDNLPDLAIAGDAAGDGEQLSDVSHDQRYFDEENTSPEFTLTYRPSDEWTAFVSYKEGYKGPGFNINTTATAYNDAVVNPFGGETVDGFEGGIKALLLDRRFALTAAAYTYDYSDLQVAFVNNVTQTVDIRNGADARVRGVELGATWEPAAISGLTLNGFVNYNDSKYTSFPAAPCYGGQTEAEGCLTLASGGTGQNLNGRTLANAPEWVAQLGAEYERPIGSSLQLGLTFNTNYSSDYLYIPELHPGGKQDAYATYDASVRIGAANDLWDVALIGRNLSNEAVVSCGQDGGTVIPGVPSDPIAFVLRSRQILLQLTVRPGRR
jgi:outer membrane receptor protein involved in Fe transport